MGARLEVLFKNGGGTKRIAVEKDGGRRSGSDLEAGVLFFEEIAE